MKVELSAEPYRKERKGDTKRLRDQGKIPAVLYGHKEKTTSISIDGKEFKKVLEILKQESATINLKVENKAYHCFVKSIQHNPINGEFLHIDFQHIHKKEKIKTGVPIRLTGKAPGLEKGGILDQHIYEVVVRCLPDEMPSHIEVDISNLDLGEAIHLNDINLPHIEFELSPNTPIVSILVPKAEVVKPAPKEEVVTEEKEKEVEKPKEEEKKEEK
jgi:large subunit ribosomal protein L25